MIDAVLRPGDVLYLPRGFLHSATALGEISAHLTIGIHPVTRWAAAESALDLVRTMAAEDPRAARLPAARARPRRPATRSGTTSPRWSPACASGWTASTPPRSPTGCAPAPGRRCGPEPVTPLAQSAAATALTAQSVLRLRRRLRCALRDGDDGRVTLLAGRQSHTFPGEAREALTALLAAGELKAGDLPGLDPDDRLTLARRLVTEAIATVAHAEAGRAAPGRRARWRAWGRSRGRPMSRRSG